jgi:hypothetical protein
MHRSKLLLLFGVYLATGTAAAETKVCLSGVCIGAPVEQLPKNISWISSMPPKPSAFMKPIAYRNRLEKYLKADKETIDQLQPYADEYGTITSLNPNVLRALGQVRGACQPYRVKGSFKSESGHTTDVVVSTVPNEDGTAQRFIVTSLGRSYGPMSKEDEVRFGGELVKQLGVPVEADGQPNVLYRRDRPTASLRAGRLSISIAAEIADREESTRRLAGCSSVPKID